MQLKKTPINGMEIAVSAMVYALLSPCKFAPVSIPSRSPAPSPNPPSETVEIGPIVASKRYSDVMSAPFIRQRETDPHPYRILSVDVCFRCFFFHENLRTTHHTEMRDCLRQPSDRHQTNLLRFPSVRARVSGSQTEGTNNMTYGAFHT